MTTAYRIKDWECHFENSRSKQVQRLDWVPVPNKHDGDGFTELLDHERGTAHFGAWVLIVELASKCQPRGTLVRDNQRPHDAKSIARVTRGASKLIEEAIERLLQIGWLEEVLVSDERSERGEAGAAEGGSPVPVRQEPDTHLSGSYQADDGPPQKAGDARAERNGTEGNGREEHTHSAHARGGDPPKEEPDAHIPSIQEVVKAGQDRLGDAIPEDYCHHYHATKEAKNSWLNGQGRLVKWRKELAQWWERDKHAWSRKQHPAQRVTGNTHEPAHRKKRREREPQQTFNPTEWT